LIFASIDFYAIARLNMSLDSEGSIKMAATPPFLDICGESGMPVFHGTKHAVWFFCGCLLDAAMAPESH